MTLEELDDALKRFFGLDFKYVECRKIRERIFEKYGIQLLQEKKERCSRCWLKEHGRCSEECPSFSSSDNPIDVGREYIARKNDVSLFSFICLFVIPVYEEDTGKRNTIEKMGEEFKRLWKKKMKREKGENKNNFPYD